MPLIYTLGKPCQCFYYFQPELQKLEQKLAALGLKDPWIRNEVWRFDKGFQPTQWGNAKVLFKRFVDRNYLGDLL